MATNIKAVKRGEKMLNNYKMIKKLEDKISELEKKSLTNMTSGLLLVKK